MAHQLPALALFAPRTKCFEQTLGKLSRMGQGFRFMRFVSARTCSAPELFSTTTAITNEDIKKDGNYNCSLPKLRRQGQLKRSCCLPNHLHPDHPVNLYKIIALPFSSQTDLHPPTFQTPSFTDPRIKFVLTLPLTCPQASFSLFRSPVSNCCTRPIFATSLTKTS